jgi:sugar lactone lactonase YvrE
VLLLFLEDTLKTIARSCLGFLLFGCVFAASLPANAATPNAVTVAGGYLGNGKPATSASLNFPEAVALDAKGNVYVTDSVNCQIRKVTTKGVIVPFAGSLTCGYGGDGGPALSAKLFNPSGLAFESDGSLLVADSANSRIRKIAVGGTITTFAGNGVYGYSGDNGTATQASLSNPIGVSVDSLGNVYIVDSSNNVIRKVDPAGIIHTVAGNHVSGFSGDGGPATAAQLNYPQGTVSDGMGNLYISDYGNFRIRKVDASGTITTYAGNGNSSPTGTGGLATSIGIGTPAGLVLAQGKLYITTSGDIWDVDLGTQIITLIAGPSQGNPGFNGDGNSALSTLFAYIGGLSIDSAGNLFVADSGNGRIRKISTSQIVSTLAGGYTGDGGRATGSSLNIDFFDHAGFDPQGNLYIADYYNNRVRRVSTGGIITTFAGTGMTGPSPDGGLATATNLIPVAVVADQSGNIFISDEQTGYVRKVDSTGTVSTVSKAFSIFGGALATDKAGNLYAADGLSVVWKVPPSGPAIIVAGKYFQPGYNGDDIAATSALLNTPRGVSVDSSGNLYICDTGNNRIRRVDTSGTITTVAGNGSAGFSGDGGPATSAMLFAPSDVAVDTKGNIYIADRINARIRIVNSLGTIETFAGSGGFGYNGNHLPALNANMYPSAVTVSPTGVVYVVDEGSSRVRKIH